MPPLKATKWASPRLSRCRSRSTTTSTSGLLSPPRKKSCPRRTLSASFSCGDSSNTTPWAPGAACASWPCPKNLSRRPSETSARPTCSGARKSRKKLEAEDSTGRSGRAPYVRAGFFGWYSNQGTLELLTFLWNHLTPQRRIPARSQTATISTSGGSHDFGHESCPRSRQGCSHSSSPPLPHAATFAHPGTGVDRAHARRAQGAFHHAANHSRGPRRGPGGGTGFAHRAHRGAKGVGDSLIVQGKGNHERRI